jgi:hypothetical protein
MRIDTGLAGTELAFFSRPRATSGASDCQHCFLADFHASIVSALGEMNWSKVNSFVENDGRGNIFANSCP